MDDGKGRVTPLRAWSEAQGRQLGEVVRKAHLEWQVAWIGASPGPSAPDGIQVSCCAPSEAGLAASAWRPHGTMSGLWWTMSSAAGAGAEHPASVIQGVLFGGAFPAGWRGAVGSAAGQGQAIKSLAEETASAAWEAWWKQLDLALHGADRAGGVPAAAAPALESALKPWSGALVLGVPFQGTWLHLLVSWGRVQQCVHGAGGAWREQVPPRAVAPVWSAVARRHAKLRALLEPFELELGAIASLHVGDVLSTTHPLEAPLVLEVGTDDRSAVTHMGRALLGRLGDTAAIELISPPEA